MKIHLTRTIFAPSLTKSLAAGQTDAVVALGPGELMNVGIPFHLLIDFSVCPTGFHTAALVQHNCFAAFARTKNSLLRTLVYYSVCPFKSQGGNSQKIAYLRGFCGFPPLMHYCAKVFFLPIIISPDYFLTFSVFR